MLARRTGYRRRSADDACDNALERSNAGNSHFETRGFGTLREVPVRMFKRIAFACIATSIALSVFTAQASFDDEGFRIQEVVLTDHALGNRYLNEFYTSPRGKRIFAKIQKANPQIQKALRVRDQLLSILSSFELETGAYENQRYIETVRKAFSKSAHQGSIVDEYNVHFEFEGGRFQVEGIDPTRLAVNDGLSITFNAEVLGEKRRSLAELTQLWLHEILHQDPDSSLASRDAFGAKVGAFVGERTQEIVLKNGEIITALLLKQKNISTIDSNYRGLQAVFNSDLQSKFLLLRENSSGTRADTDIYQAFRTYEGSLKNAVPEQFHPTSYGTRISWPSVQVTSMKLTNDHILRFNYEQNETSLTLAVSNKYEKNSDQGHSDPRLPTSKFRLDLNLEKNETQIQRNYGEPLADGDFEIFRVQLVNQRRFVSLRLNIPEGMKAAEFSRNIQLVGRTLFKRRPVAAVLIQSRFLTNDEVLLHFEVPVGAFDMSHIMVPKISGEGMYSENILLPSKSLSLIGPASDQDSQLKSKKLTIERAPSDQFPVKASLELHTAKLITGVSLELEHSVVVQKPQWNGSQTLEPLHLGIVGIGRKYFIDRKSLGLRTTNNTTSMTFAVPKALMSQTVLGPLIVQKMSWFYTLRTQPRGSSIVDTLQRKIDAFWIHYQDGTTERLPAELLPESFTMRSVEAEVKENADILRSVRNRMQTIDMGEAKTCKEVF